MGAPTADFSIPSLELGPLVRRAALPAALVGAAAAAFAIAGGPAQAFLDAIQRALEADPAWVAGAVAFELLSFVGYIALLWLVGGRASQRLRLREATQVTLGGAAATRLLPTAGVGGAALTLWSLRRSGLSMRGATRTLLAFLVLLYSVFLGSIAVTGTLLALDGVGPIGLTAIPAAGATLAILLALAAAAFAPATGTGKIRSAASVLGGGVRDALGHVRSADGRLLGALAWWGFDMAVLWAMLNAFGSPPAFALVVLAYFVGQVGNTIPIPGAVSGGLVGALLAFGVQADLAIVSVLAYRAIAIWIPVPVGLLALSSLRRTLVRWGEEETPEPVIEETPEPVIEVVPAAPRPLQGRLAVEPFPCREPIAA